MPVAKLQKTVAFPGRDIPDDDRVVLFDFFQNSFHTRTQMNHLPNLIAVLSGIQFFHQLLWTEISIDQKHLVRRI